MSKSFLILVIIGLAAWAISLQRRLYNARMRGDMYRDISMRLDQQRIQLNEQGR